MQQAVCSSDPLGTGKMIHSKTTVTFYDYDADIKIEPPAL